MKKFCRYLKEHARKLIDYQKKEMIPLTYEENESYKNQKVCYICKKRFNTDDDNEEYRRVRGHCHYTIKCRSAAHNICNLRYEMLK